MSSASLYRQINNANKRCAYAWARYYDLHEQQHGADTHTYTALEAMPTHIVDELKEVMVKLKKKIECPVCLDIIAVEGLAVTQCGHKYCKNCLSALKNMGDPKCAVCRRKIK